MIMLRFEGVSVEYPGVKALDDVSFEVSGRSVHALMGENGAGKSTVLRVLAGVQPPSAGKLSVDGELVKFRSARDALVSGIAVIYQELNLVPNMSVADNLLLGQIPSRRGFLKQGQIVKRARAMLAEMGEDLDPDAAIGSLPLGQRQMVEIGKALLREARIIAFDEPTSALSAGETTRLKRIVTSLRDRGCAIIYVTHRLEEVFDLCDSATVLRDGRCTARYPQVSAASPSQLIRDMVGREIADVYGFKPRPISDLLFRVIGLAGPGLSEPVSFSVRRGEIVGFFGLVGSGRTELMRLLCGAEPGTEGKVELRGHSVRYAHPRAAIADGVALCPEDRKREGIFPLASVSDNLNISVRRRGAYAGMFLNRDEERRVAVEYIQRLGVKTPSPATPIAHLSGGNQQKVILARWLAEDVDLLIMDEPTRGIDVGARAEIYRILFDLGARGKAIILVSSDLAEVASVADRVIVMRGGKIVGELDRANAQAETILAMALPQ